MLTHRNDITLDWHDAPGLDDGITVVRIEPVDSTDVPGYEDLLTVLVSCPATDGTFAHAVAYLSRVTVTSRMDRDVTFGGLDAHWLGPTPRDDEGALVDADVLCDWLTSLDVFTI